MAFEPDILVTSADGSDVLLVAETKWHIKDILVAENQLKAYMMGMRSPIGLLITPTLLRIYRDRYVIPPEKSIQLIGEFDVQPLFGSHSRETGRNAASGFENDVQGWLESLVSKSPGAELSSGFRHALELNIIPAISQGVIRAAHPRSALRA